MYILNTYGSFVYNYVPKILIVPKYVRIQKKQIIIHVDKSQCV